MIGNEKKVYQTLRSRLRLSLQLVEDQDKRGSKRQQKDQLHNKTNYQRIRPTTVR